MSAPRATAVAPGKVIFTGEQFVVHGSMALAAAIGKKVTAVAERSPGLSVRSERFSAEDSLAPVMDVVRSMYRERRKEPAVRLSISSEIPPGSGLGSSAATMVASVSAVDRLEGWDLTLEEIIDRAMVGERAIHGTPSGIDPTAAALGGVFLFKMGERPKVVGLRRPVKLIVAHSGTERRTKDIVSKVSEMSKSETQGSLFAKLCDGASLITNEAYRSLAEGRLRELGTAITLNHALLGRVGASTEELDSMVDLCIREGAYGAKLTGAGGGGSIMAVAEEGNIQRIQTALKRGGFDSFVAEVPCDGVKAWREGGGAG